MTINLVIKQNIKKYLDARSWKQIDLAREAGIPVSTIQNIYSDRTNDPKITTLMAISEALNVSLYDLIGYKNISAQHKAFFQSVILTVEQHAKDQELLLTETQRAGIVHDVYQFALKKVGTDKNAPLVIDMTYLEMLLKSSSTP